MAFVSTVIPNKLRILPIRENKFQTGSAIFDEDMKISFREIFEIQKFTKISFREN